MSPDQGLASLIDSSLKPKGHIEIKRHPLFDNKPVIELIVWEPTTTQFPKAVIRLHGHTVLDVLDQLESHLISKVDQEPGPREQEN